MVWLLLSNVHALQEELSLLQRTAALPAVLGRALDVPALPYCVNGHCILPLNMQLAG